jgi:hypothetical protein
MHDDSWIRKITLDENFSMAHASQFVDLWAKIREVHHNKSMEGDIVWKLAANGQYSMTSAYNAQFLGVMMISMYTLVSKIWAPPKRSFRLACSSKPALDG